MAIRAQAAGAGCTIKIDVGEDGLPSASICNRAKTIGTSIASPRARHGHRGNRTLTALQGTLSEQPYAIDFWIFEAIF